MKNKKDTNQLKEIKRPTVITLPKNKKEILIHLSKIEDKTFNLP